MSIFSMISSGVGGLGLFLLGMWLMSDGLKMAAGNTLNQLLHDWTNTRLRGLGVGILLTSLIQSSSAVTVATIGFTNAGLLSLRRAIWIVFGSNIGTTTTGWLVTLIGFNFKISAFALPMIGIGMVIKLAKTDRRIGALGQALVGFGILFLGIDILKDTFSVLGDQVSLIINGEIGVKAILIYTGLGFLITLLMQSSSVTLAITLTALSGGIVSLIPAAAITIGSNLGSTTTAIFASFGANPIAKRVMASHVIFNLVTALVSLILLSPLINTIIFLQSLFHLGDASIITLTLFHTIFNILGVALMWPLADKLVLWLSHCFKTKYENEAKPVYLDKNALSIPSLALHALYKELQRVGHYSLAMAKESINFETSNAHMAVKNAVVDKLIIAIGDYSSNLYKQNLTSDVADALPSILRISQYYDAISELSILINADKKNVQTAINNTIQEQINAFYKHSVHLLNHAAPGSEIAKGDELKKELDTIESEYQSLKSLLLRRGAEGKLSIAKMDKTMASISQIRRILQQAVKALIHFETLHIDVTRSKINEQITSV